MRPAVVQVCLRGQHEDTVCVTGSHPSFTCEHAVGKIHPPVLGVYKEREEGKELWGDLCVGMGCICTGSIHWCRKLRMDVSPAIS